MQLHGGLMQAERTWRGESWVNEASTMKPESRSVGRDGGFAACSGRTR